MKKVLDKKKLPLNNLSMNDQIIIISDIHIKDNENESAINKIIALNEMIAREDSYVDNLYVVCAGDIANSGKKTEYKEFLAACALLREEVSRSHPGMGVRFICIPGNHDVNYNINRKICEKLLTSESIDPTSYEEFHSEFEERFEDYYEFSKALCDNAINNKCFWIQEYNAGMGKTLRFNLYNSAIYSGYGKDKGYLWYPVEYLKQGKEKAGATLTIGVMHHPLEWFNIKQKKTLVEEILPDLDILITGHDHSMSYSERKNYEYDYLSIETDAFDGEAKATTEGIISLYIDWGDGDKAYVKVFSYTWDGEKYTCGIERDNKTIQLADINHGYELEKEFKEELKRLPYPMISAENKEITSDDVFIYPNLEKTSKQMEGSLTVNSLDLLNNSELGNYHIIYGESKSGKTTLARRLFRDLLKQGKVPVFIDYECDKYQKIGTCINKNFAKEYSARRTDNYLSIDAVARALIIDNYNPEKKNAKAKLEDLLQIKESINTIIVFIDSDYFINCSNSSNLFDNVSSEYNLLKIVELNHRGRHQLIQNWVKIGSGEYRNAPQSELHEIIEKEQAITNLFGDSLVPRYPMYITMFLSAMSALNNQNNYNVGTYGSLYETVIRQQLLKLRSLELQNMVNFLAEFSHYVYINNSSKYFSESDYTKFSVCFNEKYDMDLKPQTIFDDLIEKRIFVRKRSVDNLLSFCHDYFYYYFIALYFDSNAGSVEVSNEMKALCNNFYKKDQANIWLFLTHISHKNIVVDTLVYYANSILSDRKEVRFDDDINFVERLRQTDFNLQFRDKDYEKLQADRYAGEDRSEIVTRTIESTPYDDTHPNDPVVLIVQANKAVDALGQLLRNFVASLDSRQKQVLIDTTLRLTLRTISYVLEGVFNSAPDYIEDYVKLHPELNNDNSRKEAIDKFSTFLYFLLLFYSSSTLSRTARSLAHKMLQPSYEKYFNKQEVTNSFTIFNYLIQLFVKKNPSKFLPADKLRTLNKYLYCKETIRCIMFQFIYMYVDDVKVKQSLCEQYQISYKKIVLKESKAK